MFRRDATIRLAVALGSCALLWPVRGIAGEKTRVRVDKLRQIDENGAELTQYTRTVTAALEARGYLVVPHDAPAGAFDIHLARLVLVKSKLHPPGFGNNGSSTMTVQAYLVRPAQPDRKLGPFTTHTDFEPGEWQGNDVTVGAAQRALSESLRPLLNMLQLVQP